MLKKLLLLAVAAVLSAMPSIAENELCDYQNIDAECVEHTRKQAEQGSGEAQSILGAMYYHGEGVDHDYSEAVRWYRMAAEQGVTPAQFHLGSMYAQGQGAERDYYEALIWLLIAKVGGAEHSEEAMAFVAKELTLTEIKSADEEAKRRFVEIEDRRNATQLAN